MHADFAANTIRYAIESFFPRCLTVLSVFADQGASQPFAWSLSQSFTSPGPNTANAAMAASSAPLKIPNVSKAVYEC